MNIGIRHSDCPRQTAGGFTLVEILFASVILSLSVVALLSAITLCIDMVRLSRENVRATQIIQSKMESIRLCNWEQLNDPDFIPRRFAESYYARDKAEPGLIYLGRVRVSEVPSDTPYRNDLRHITVNVTWRSADVVREREMNTLVSRYGLQHYIF
jgi:uncharacterized protein (TIGR02598 family)